MVLGESPVSEYVVDVELVFVTISDQVVPLSSDLSISYPVSTESPLSDGDVQDRLICDEEIAMAVRPVGGCGDTGPLGPTVNRAECVLVPSVACTLCEPVVVLGTWNVVTNPPVELDVTVASAVPSQLNVIEAFDKNALLIPVAVTLVPTGPLDGASVSAVSL